MKSSLWLLALSLTFPVHCKNGITSKFVNQISPEGVIPQTECLPHTLCLDLGSLYLPPDVVPRTLPSSESTLFELPVNNGPIRLREKFHQFYSIEGGCSLFWYGGSS
ncbi:hypothetical protein BC830DRAFT_1102628 [Chytriomyces sp. MP71]|nr:hypothetical protein BC830DRAFT_1102628 [Chytriomyces sp. MP71]